jgi:glycosyltransferase involved in cell wall biosynthesis
LQGTDRVKLLIDAQACQTDSRDRGIGRYVSGFIEALVATGRTRASILLGRGDPDRLRDARGRFRAQRVEVPVIACAYPTCGEVVDLDPDLGQASGLLRGRLTSEGGFDVILVTSVFEGYDGGAGVATTLDHACLEGVLSVAIAYDLIPLVFPDHYLQSPAYANWYRKKLQELVRHDVILAISASTRDDLIALAGARPEQVHVIGAGVDPSVLHTGLAHDEAADELAVLGVRAPFVLVAGNADWRKNSVGALHAFRGLPEELVRSHQLVFAQVGNDVRELLARPEWRKVKERTVILGKVHDRALASLYKSCRVVLFPSLYEGFGLPAIEAMAFGAPLVASARGAIPEVVDCSDALFDPDDLDDVTGRLRRVLVDESFRAGLTKDSSARAAQFTWARCAATAIEVIERELATTPRRARRGWAPTEADVRLLADAIVKGDAAADKAVERGLTVVAGKGRRRLLVDVTCVSLVEAWTGIQRVVRNYCAGLQASSRLRDVEVLPFRWSEDGIRLARLFCRDGLGLHVPGDDELLVVEPNDVVFMLDSTWESPERFHAFLDDVVDCGGEIVWMVYDLVPIRVPETCHPGMPPVFAHWLSYATARTDGFLCISEATRLDLESYLDESLAPGQRRPWTRSLHLGSDLESGAKGSPTGQGLELAQVLHGRSYALAIGTIEPRKDYDTMLAGFDMAWDAGSDIALVVVGKAGWNVEATVERLTTNPRFGKHLFWLSAASDGDLDLLLASATVLVQASMLEGFGLPIVEAGSRGVPLLLSDIPVFREIAADEAEYFPAGDARGMADQIRRHDADGKWRVPQNIRTLTWSESSRMLLDILVPPDGTPALSSSTPESRAMPA